MTKYVCSWCGSKACVHNAMKIVKIKLFYDNYNQVIIPIGNFQYSSEALVEISKNVKISNFSEIKSPWILEEKAKMFSRTNYSFKVNISSICKRRKFEIGLNHKILFDILKTCDTIYFNVSKKMLHQNQEWRNFKYTDYVVRSGVSVESTKD